MQIAECTKQLPNLVSAEILQGGKLLHMTMLLGNSQLVALNKCNSKFELSVIKLSEEIITGCSI
jgi:hypothetical protein